MKSRSITRAVALVAFLLVASMASAQINYPRPDRPVHVGHSHYEHEHYGGLGYQSSYMEGAAIDLVATPEQIDAIVDYLRHLNFDDNRLDAARLCVYLCSIPVSGLFRIAETFTFDDRRVDFLIYAYRFCPDPENYHQLEATCKFRSSAERLCRQLPLH